jgi:nanoRNase/pAp phosphatase (c-di-AMP/oligoRNAs hydrolase)
LGEVLKKCIEGFEDSTAGGHDRAAGGDFPKKYLEEFKSRLIKELSDK